VTDKNALEQGHGVAWGLLDGVRDNAHVAQWLAESDARRVPAPLWHRKPFWAAAAGVVMTVALGTAGYWHSRAQHFATGIGEQRDVLLADGSRVTLNTATSLTVRYSKSSRHIDLERGEALFKVKHDASRPFDVAAGETLTRAVGTEFNVDLRPSQVTITVLDGTVRVSAPESNLDGARSADQERPARNTEVPVVKGHALAIHSNVRETRDEKADLKRIDAWITRRLEFSDTPLPQAVEEFNRYSITQVTIGSPDLQSVRVSGVFGIGDTDGFLYSLREALGVQTQASGGGVILTRAR
jgi:transmembrane sensor